MGLGRTIFRAKQRIRYTYLPKTREWASILYDDLFKQRPPGTPPRRLDFIGGGPFLDIGNEFMKYFVELGGLQPHHRVLDIGCGLGRMALPLTKYLDESTEYHGVDIVSRGINWCEKNISKAHPNFKFHLLDVYSHRYNRKGKFKAADYELPFESNSFDFICANSVFTHMLASDVNNYVEEVHRMLKPGGVSFLTYFLLNDEARKGIEDGVSDLSFKFKMKETWYNSEDVPEGATGFLETDIRKLYASVGLQIDEPIHFGKWCGRKPYVGYQDKIVARKG